MIDRRTMTTQLAALPFAGLLTTGMAAPKRPVIGKAAPDFTLRMVDDSKVGLSELHGRVIVLNFWATWCVPCRKELPLLEIYYRQRKDAGLSIFAIMAEESFPIKMLRQLSTVMQMPSARSIRGPYSPIDGALPTNFVIDRKGVLRYARADAFNLREMNELLLPLLSEPA